VRRIEYRRGQGLAPTNARVLRLGPIRVGLSSDFQQLFVKWLLRAVPGGFGRSPAP
jgi:hypothetical protein